MYKVLVVGSGGRCHAIVDALSRSPQVKRIYCAPGNAGIAAQAECVPIKDTDVSALKEFALKNDIYLTVVGPEASLSVGIVDEFQASGLKIFGHTKAATRIESSKEFAKILMKKYGILTADYQSFNDYEQALKYVSNRPFPAVLKYDGLAAGKGVVIAENLDEARKALKDMLLDASFGSAKVVIEDYLTGPEFSFMAFVDGDKVYPMPLAQDHKRAYDGDKGPNTGGMGAYTGLNFISEEEKQFAYTEILCRTASAMVAEGCPLSGVLYAGLMKTPKGIKVIEFNARFGDPETEVVLPLMESDIFDIFERIATPLRRLVARNDDGKTRNDESFTPKFSDKYSFGVVMASKGYPGSYAKGFEINNLPLSGVYQMGTAFKDGKLVTNGGRVLMVTAQGESLEAARNEVYDKVSKIQCENLFYRNDIGHIALSEGIATPPRRLVARNDERMVCNDEGTLHNDYSLSLRTNCEYNEAGSVAISGNIINGKKISLRIKDELKEAISKIKNKRVPCLAVIIVGSNPASQVYVRNKIKAAEYTGMESRLIALEESISEAELLTQIDALNKDENVDGILVQLPLPKHINESKVIYSISASKDVDGFHPENVAGLWLGSDCVLPCTPKGCIELIKSTGVQISGKRAVVVGRSNIVGKPVAKLLLDENATVTIAHSRSNNLKEICQSADILVVAVGKAKLITGDMIKPGAVVIDVGMNHDAQGKLCGDVDFDSAVKVAGYITPVPGGVGPMTIAMLMKNTLECYLERNNY